LIKLTRKRLALIAVAATVIVAAILSTWWYSLGPVERTATLKTIWPIIVFGTLSGTIYALLALGMTLIYGVAEVVNMAHGALFMFGAYMSHLFFFRLQLDMIPSIALSVIFTGIVGVAIYLLTIHPIITDILATMVTTIGVSILIQQIILVGFQGRMVPVPTFVPREAGSFDFFGVTVTYSQVIAAAISIIFIAILWIFIAKFKIGKAMRAAAQDREAAMLMGVNTTRLYMITIAISASLAALAGICISAAYTGIATPTMWTSPLVMSFAIVIVGGLGSIKGSIVGAFIVGYAETVVLLEFPEGGFLKGAAALVILVLALLVRPRGLFGKRKEME